MNVRRQLESAPAAAATAPQVNRAAVIDASVQEALDKMQRAEETRSNTTGSLGPATGGPGHHDQAGRRSRPGAMRKESDHGR